LARRRYRPRNPARGVGDEKEREKGRHSSGEKIKATLQLENRELNEGTER